METAVVEAGFMQKIGLFLLKFAHPQDLTEEVVKAIAEGQVAAIGAEVKQLGHHILLVTGG
jgi:hypothetical protein